MLLSSDDPVKEADISARPWSSSYFLDSLLCPDCWLCPWASSANWFTRLVLQWLIVNRQGILVKVPSTINLVSVFRPLDVKELWWIMTWSSHLHVQTGCFILSYFHQGSRLFIYFCYEPSMIHGLFVLGWFHREIRELDVLTLDSDEHD